MARKKKIQNSDISSHCSFYQYNLRKKAPCNVDLYNLIEQDKCTGIGIVVGITEPNINREQGVNPTSPNDSFIYHRETKRKTPTRAALYYSKDVQMSQNK